jgi:hypothetical protein
MNGHLSWQAQRLFSNDRQTDRQGPTLLVKPLWGTRLYKQE